MSPPTTSTQASRRTQKSKMTLLMDNKTCDQQPENQTILKRKRNSLKVGTANKKPKEDVKPFRLLDLPPELWVKIGRLVIDRTGTCTTQSIMSAFDTRKRQSLDHLRSMRPAITHTCRTLRDELLPYFYRTRGDFTVEWWTLGACILGQWLRSIDASRRSAVRNLHIERVEWTLAQKERQGTDLVEEMEGHVGEKWGVELKMELEAVEGLSAKYKVMLL
ncbi:hypothetical protein CLAFUW4_03655 [Fulvia fulva]|nr:hypothetical protein CLAFUR4_03643 [Fulvia fulva]KAK4633459.1 hypothetical protein CLAFUR0_03646 [Fulvia fulva]WPV11212.1 hypothetical protein CLAFUW4_03655 [Fulvia fulva]WPV26829.1 hypothetical protein CLAFUW7_03647 [Fulvia fulva]